jgi:nitroimidazol reductase NimA-like FMN-containing flavoprotein (pyridoxamine 5'-phosphate oxidase superfamily)
MSSVLAEQPAPTRPVKLPAEAIFALLDGAPFGRLTTYAPPSAEGGGRVYVVPLQFVQRPGRLYLITRPGRKLTNLQAAPRGVCLQLDLAEPAGWTSVCAWGDYRDVTDRRERASALLASFQKYPARTVHQGVSMLRRRTASAANGGPGTFVIGALELGTVSGRQWPGLVLPPSSPLLQPGLPDVSDRARGAPVFLTRDQCFQVLDDRPLARLGCYHPAKARCYCVPLWFLRQGADLWFYHPRAYGALVDALTAHPHGVCVQVDSLDCSRDSDPAQPWRSVLADGQADLMPLGPDGPLAFARQTELLVALRRRLQGFGIAPPFIPPERPFAPAPGLLLRVRMARISGQATG